MGLCDGPVQTAGCPVTDQLKQKHHTVICVLGNCQVDTFPRLGGDLDDWITYPKISKQEVVRQLYKTCHYVTHKVFTRDLAHCTC